MSTARGLLASLGAGGSIAVAGTTALLAVSTVVAFDGWPVQHEKAASSALSVPATPAHSRATQAGTGPAIVVASAAVGPDLAATRSVAERPAARSAARTRRDADAGRDGSAARGGGSGRSVSIAMVPENDGPVVTENGTPKVDVRAPAASAAPASDPQPEAAPAERSSGAARPAVTSAPAAAAKPAADAAPAAASRPAPTAAPTQAAAPVVTAVTQSVQNTAAAATPVVEQVVAPVQQTVAGVGQAVPAVAPVTDLANQTLTTVTGILNGLSGRRAQP